MDAVLEARPCRRKSLTISKVDEDMFQVEERKLEEVRVLQR